MAGIPSYNDGRIDIVPVMSRKGYLIHRLNFFPWAPCCDVLKGCSLITYLHLIQICNLLGASTCPWKRSLLGKCLQWLGMDGAWAKVRIWCPFGLVVTVALAMTALVPLKIPFLSCSYSIQVGWLCCIRFIVIRCTSCSLLLFPPPSTPLLYVHTLPAGQDAITHSRPSPLQLRALVWVRTGIPLSIPACWWYPSASQMCSHLLFTALPWGAKGSIIPFCTEDLGRERMTCSRAYKKSSGEPGSEPQSPVSHSNTLSVWIAPLPKSWKCFYFPYLQL